ncbi:hypothetical protein [Marinobacterium rhizophilum]|uniref:Adhesin n=1 Tax=Marinobacterium rhizophilum TaxID=420402 RepID=A0ABY5HK98_9GAMM|nr:hypothetical protein [Marinobacterium rhizophilum]UTW12549.1 hypothetical protein KDW95_02365 [Marinobacterium rhizophilum]
MNKQFKMVPLALAIASLCMAGTAMANEGGEGGGGDGKDGRRFKEGAHLSKVVKVKKYVEYKGEVAIEGTIKVDSLGMAVVDIKQESDDNDSYNTALDNEAGLDNSSLRNARGNIGVNLSAGDNNVQGNAAALAATDAAFVFGSGDAEIFVEQDAKDNQTWNLGVKNKATISGNALRNARGNIGVNVASGNNNIQQNSLAASTTSGRMSEATVSVDQSTRRNYTENKPLDKVVITRTNVTLTGPVDGTYSGGSTSGSYNGVSDQIGDVYPDIWTGDVHPDGSQTGHFDLDRFAQGASDLNGDGGALAFRERGQLQFTEVGNVHLDAVLTGQVVHRQHVYIRPLNKAKMDGNSLRNARGNIGVNVAAGTNNLQNNSLAISHLDMMLPGTEPEPPVEP